MKKFTILFSTVVMVFVFLSSAQAKDITIYVQADQQPNIHFWGYPAEESQWPGVKLTETTTVNTMEGTPITFYYKIFTNLADDATINFLFNYNGDADKTHDINNIGEDRYYIFKGNHEYEDITSQFKDVPDAEIEKVQLPGDFSGWNGDANTFEAGEGNYTYVRTIDFSEVTTAIVTFKLLVNNSNWLGWNDLNVSAPDGWVQEAANDGNIQLNLAAIGAKQFTFTAIWGGGNMASAGWKLIIDADANAIIEKAQLPGSYCGWNGDNATLTKGEDNKYTYSLDLSDVTDETVQLKVLVNGRHWLGYNDLVSVDAPEGWAQEAASDGNIQLNLTAADTKKFKFTATWAGGKNASAGWSLKIEAEGTTGISSLTSSKNADAPVYDLSGRQVAHPTQGLYIVNGRKVIVK